MVCLKYTLVAFSILVAILAAITAIISVVVTADQNSLQRFCVVVTATKLNTSSNGHMIGAVSLKSSESKIGWKLQYNDFSGIPIGVSIHGPVQPGLSVAQIAVALCGTPSSLACDTSVAGQLNGEIGETGTGGGPLKPVIQAIRNEPWKYYLQINTGSFPNGEVTGDLNSLCGTPV
ncbi:hypothetical protein OAB94_02165 [Flavobacteriaceae bacterium]|nr:hypothetical protein [Flavobacteriaceae bacterium]